MRVMHCKTGLSSSKMKKGRKDTQKGRKRKNKENSKGIGSGQIGN